MSTWKQKPRVLAMAGVVGASLIFGACSEDTPGKKVDLSEASPDCDALDTHACSFPWPSNQYLVSDPSTATGLRLSFGATSLPKSKKQIDPSGYEILDGYGVSSPVMFYFKNLDLTGMAHELDVSVSMKPDSPTLLLKVNEDGTLTQVPHWIEGDLRQSNVEQRHTFLRPALILEEATRYIVVLRNLKDTDGAAIPRGEAFDELVHGRGGNHDVLANRQAHFDEVFDLLDKHGIDAKDLTLAWDFTTASSNALHGKMLSIRDQTISAVGTDGPEMTITDIREFQNTDPGAENYHTEVAFEFRGTFKAPLYMKPDGPKSWIFNLNANGEVEQNGWKDEDFYIMVPWSAVGTDAEPAGLMQYGHGLLGRGSQVFGGFNKRIGQEYNYIHFGSDWTGMSEDDLPALIGVMSDFSKSRHLSDNLHQGMSEFVALARGMMHRFGTLPEVTSREIQIDNEKIFYNGISQGGIFGATYVAISPDIHVGHLGVPGLNYNMLLQRSVDFDLYDTMIKSAYKSPLNTAIVLAALQNVWDMADPASYYRHLSADPFPGAPPKHVLLAPALGDYQVSPLTNLMAANSNVDLAVMEGWGRDITHMGLQEQPYMVDGAPYKGSAVVMWNLGNPWPAPGNLTPIDEGDDPHGTPRYFYTHQEQMIHFLESGGEVIDVCNGNGCNFTKNATCPSTNYRDSTCWTDD